MEGHEKLLKVFGIRLGKAYFYQDRVIDSSLEPRTIIHEIAHFQVANWKRRYMENFGLGIDTWGTGSLLLPERQVIEEYRAIMLTLFWYEALGTEKTTSVPFRYRGEHYLVQKDLRKKNRRGNMAFDWLLERNLLDHNLRPTHNLNEHEED